MPKYNIQTAQGQDKIIKMQLTSTTGGVTTPVNITGYVFEGYYGEEMANQFPLITEITDAPSGKWQIRIPRATTQTLDYSTAYDYNVFMTDTGDFRTKILQGKLKVKDSVE